MTASAPVSGVEIRAAAGPRFEEILSPPALRFLADLHRRFDARRRELLGRAPSGRSASTPARRRTSWPRRRPSATATGKSRRSRPTCIDRRVEITGPVDRKMIVNALNSGAKVFMADFEDATSPVFANMIEGQANLKDRWAGRIDFTDRGHRQALRGEGQARAADGAPARLASRRAPSPRRRRGDVRLAVRLRPLCLPLRQDADGARRDAGLLPAEAGKPSRGAAVERRLRLRRSRARRPRGDVQGDGADRDPAGRVRDGRNPLRAARPHRRAQLRPLGLHLLLHQAAGQEPGVPHPRPRGDDDGQGVPRRLFAAADQDLPPPRRLRDGRHGGADPDQGRPGRQRGRLRQGARRQGARGRQRPRRHLGRPSRPRAGRDGSVRPADAAARTSSRWRATT